MNYLENLKFDVVYSFQNLYNAVIHLAADRKQNEIIILNGVLILLNNVVLIQRTSIVENYA